MQTNISVSPANSRQGSLTIDYLAKLPENTILDERSLANVFSVTPRTIRRMVNRFELPPPIPLAGRSIWIAGRVIQYINAAAEKAERDAKREIQKISKLSP